MQSHNDHHKITTLLLSDKASHILYYSVNKYCNYIHSTPSLSLFLFFVNYLFLLKPGMQIHHLLFWLLFWKIMVCHHLMIIILLKVSGAFDQTCCWSPFIAKFCRRFLFFQIFWLVPDGTVYLWLICYWQKYVHWWNSLFWTYIVFCYLLLTYVHVCALHYIIYFWPI